MASMKPLKEKPGPRMVPRPTAASVARAARNATNRMLAATPRQSPIRHSAVTPVTASKVRSFKRAFGSTGNITAANGRNTRASNKDAFDNFDGELRKQKVEVKKALINDEDKSQLENAVPDLKFEDANNVEGTGAYLNDNEENNPDASEYSFCEAPKSTSRVQTPKTRPTTPAQLNSPPTMVTVKNNIPQHLNFDGDLQNVYCTKQNEFHRLKKELDLKQQSVLEVFDTLRHIQERMQKDGLQIRESLSQDLIIFNVGDWTTEEITQLCRDAEGSAGDQAQIFSKVNILDNATIAALETEATTVPDYFAELCFQAFTARQEVIDWMKELADKNEIPNDATRERIKQYNNEGLRLYGILEETKAKSKNTMDSFTSLTKQFCQERSTLMRVEESLLRELARLKQELETHNTIQGATDATNALEEARRDLEKERASKSQLREKLTTTETQLRYARTRVAQMDKQLKEAEASIASLTGTVKSLEDKSRQREISLEARARKLKESLKTGEVTSSQLIQQRNVLQSELNEFKENMILKENQYKSQIEELNKKLNEVIASRDHEQQLLQKEREIRENLEEELNASQNAIEELKNKINDLENTKPDLDLPTEREMDLFSELNAVKDTLRIAEDEIIACKNEKIRFLDSFTKITDSDDKMGIQQKLAAELMSREEIISNMQIQIRELIKNVKLNEKKVVQYAQYVHELHSRAAADCQELPDSQAYQHLQNEVMDLKMHLLEVSTRNEELLERLAEKDQLLEQQDKTARAQARVIKVREELISMLKNKETEQSRELLDLQQDLERRMKVVDDVNKQIAAKASEIQDLFSTLENKQQQIHRLEKIVVALEEQQRRSQAQRTRNEEKISMLERELAEGIRKERKFLFF